MTGTEHPHRNLIDDLPQPIFEADARGLITFSNRCALDTFGYSPEDLQRGFHAVELITEEDRKRAGENIAKILAGEDSGPNEYLVLRKDGTAFPALVHSSVILVDGAAAGFRGTIVDLSALREAEQERHRTEELYRTVIENTGTAILIIEEDMTVSFANQEMERLAGRSREKLVGRPFPLDLVLPEYRETVSLNHRKRRNDPESAPRSYEIGFLRPEGEEKRVLLTVSIIPGTHRSIASLVDITEKVRSEQESRESEEKFRDLAENSPNMIFINQDGRIVYANRLCGTMLKYRRKDLLSPDFDFRSLIAPDSLELVADKYRAHLEGREIDTYEYGILTRDGRRLDVINNSRLITYQGRPAILGIVTDISARRRAELELKKQNKELKNLDEMKDALIRAVSHELKTPVAKHAMQLEILKPLAGAHSLTVEQLKALEVMEKSIRRQESVIRNLLDLSRLEGGDREYLREPVLLGDLLQEVLSDYGYATEVHGIEVAVEVPPLKIISDHSMLWHLFSNIVNNAIKFRRKEGARRIAITAERLDGYVEVRIRDNGIGMEKIHVDQAFTRFFQASASYEGSGVGLTLCRMITEGLDGRIVLESEGGGRGTAVTVILPLER